MKKLSTILCLLIAIVITAPCQVESPPSLALGVSGVLGEKGSIDVDVLAGIIFEKQAELKKEFIKKTFFKNLDNHSYVLWQYAYNTLDILLESNSKEAIKKNLLENSANLALVYSFSELYIQLSEKFCNNNMHDLLLAFDKDYKSSGAFDCSSEGSKTYSVKPGRLNYLKAYVLNDSDTGESIQFNHFFLDFIFEMLKGNEKVVKKLSFLKSTHPFGEDYYKEHSAYYRVKDFASDTTKGLGKAILLMEKRVRVETNILLDNFLLLKRMKDSNQSLSELTGYSAQDLTEDLLEQLKKSDSLVFDNLAASTNDVVKDLQNITNPIARQLSTTTGPFAIANAVSSSSSEKIGAQLADNLAAFQRFKNRGSSSINAYDIYFLDNNIIPLLTKLTTEYGFDPRYLGIANKFDALITKNLFIKLQSTIAKSNTGLKSLDTEKLNQFGEILDLITRLDELDKVETYEFVLKSIKNVSGMFEDRTLGVYLSTLTENLDKYTIINEEDNKVEVAVEDIITRIYAKYSNRKSSNISLYFSIGVNQSLSSDYTFETGILLPDSSGFETETANSLGYVGEKIGLKFKLFDFKRRNAFDIGETTSNWGLLTTPTQVNSFRSKEPLVSDIYFLAHGSGILYKVANLATEEEFNDPIIGFGFGVAFFNSLDLNFAYNVPLSPDNDFFNSLEKNSMFVLSFDIKITEYLTAVGEKRKEKN